MENEKYKIYEFGYSQAKCNLPKLDEMQFKRNWRYIRKKSKEVVQ